MVYKAGEEEAVEERNMSIAEVEAHSFWQDDVCARSDDVDHYDPSAKHPTTSPWSTSEC